MGGKFNADDCESRLSKRDVARGSIGINLNA